MDVKNLVKKSLHKFLDDGLDTFVTFDSNESELKSSASNLTIDPFLGTLPAGTTSFKLYQGGILFNTTEDIIGSNISVYNATFDSDVITNWDNGTGTVTIQNGFNNDITNLNFMIIGIGGSSLIYMSRAYDVPNKNTQLQSLQHQDRWDLTIKSKDDSDKSKIDKIMQDINTLVYDNKSNIPIYEETLSSIVGYGKIKNLEFNEKIDVNNDIQSYLCSFIFQYWVNYKN